MSEIKKRIIFRELWAGCLANYHRTPAIRKGISPRCRKKAVGGLTSRQLPFFEDLPFYQGRPWPPPGSWLGLELPPPPGSWLGSGLPPPGSWVAPGPALPSPPPAPPGAWEGDAAGPGPALCPCSGSGVCPYCSGPGPGPAPSITGVHSPQVCVPAPEPGPGPVAAGVVSAGGVPSSTLY
jgi:hypothetical protein